MMLPPLTMLASFHAHMCAQCVVQPTRVGVTQGTNWLKMGLLVEVIPGLGVIMLGYIHVHTIAFVLYNVMRSSSFKVFFCFCPVDINECTLQNGGCSHGCENSLGAYQCTCPSGLVLGNDLQKCAGTVCTILCASLTAD